MAAKETDLKKIELKVSVNCCDGCKKKVKKISQSIEGVLKTDIDPVEPKVTVLGNVDPQLVIKRLLKAGKQAELWSITDGNREKKEAVDTTVTTEQNEKLKSECKQSKASDSCGMKAEKEKETKNKSDHEGERKASNQDQKETIIGDKNCSYPEIAKSEIPASPQVQVSYNTTYPAFSTCNENWNKVEPYAIAVPCYAIPSYTVTPLPPSYYSHEILQAERREYPPPFLAPTTGVGDYFNDENTMGCHVM